MNVKRPAVFVAVLSRHTRSGLIRRGPRARGFSSGFLGRSPATAPWRPPTKLASRTAGLPRESLPVQLP